MWEGEGEGGQRHLGNRVNTDKRCTRCQLDVNCV